jgi:hypothetical protein
MLLSTIAGEIFLVNLQVSFKVGSLALVYPGVGHVNQSRVNFVREGDIEWRTSNPTRAVEIDSHYYVNWTN